MLIKGLAANPEFKVTDAEGEVLTPVSVDIVTDYNFVRIYAGPEYETEDSLTLEELNPVFLEQNIKLLILYYLRLLDVLTNKNNLSLEWLVKKDKVKEYSALPWNKLEDKLCKINGGR